MTSTERNQIHSEGQCLNLPGPDEMDIDNNQISNRRAYTLIVVLHLTILETLVVPFPTKYGIFGLGSTMVTYSLIGADKDG